LRRRFSLSLFVLCFSVSDVCLSLYVPFSLIGCAGSVGISLASRVMYIFCACVSAVWSAGPVRVYLGTLVVWTAGLYGFFLSLWLCSGGYGTVEMVRGVARFSFAFFSLLSVLMAVGCLR
jgi:hypothetical protein